jgi:hypothetical protein
MNHLVKILSDDAGEERDKELQYWHLAIHNTGSQTLCEGEFFGYGESGCIYRERTVERGGITCPKCIQFIDEIKAVKL